MATTYSSNLSLNIMGYNDQSGQWGNTTSLNLATLLEQAISAYVTQQFSNTDITLNTTQGADASNTTPGTIYTAGTTSSPVSFRNMFIECQGTSSGNNLIVPATPKLYVVYNNISSGGGSITVKTPSGTGVAVPTQAKYLLVCNGTNVITALTNLPITALGTPTSGTLTNCTGLPNAGLVNSGITIGSTAISLGNTVTTIAGLTLSSGNVGGCTVDGTNAVGYKNIPQNAQSGGSSYSLVTSDVGKHIYLTGTGGATIPSGVFNAGDVVTIINYTAANVTITTSAVTAYIAGTSTTGTSRTLAQRGACNLLCVSSNNFILSGAGLS